MTMTTLTRWPRFAAAIVLVALIAPGAASAQQSPPAVDMGRGMLLSGFMGTQSASSNFNPAAGLGLGWEFSRRVSLEGRGMWIRVNEGTPDFAATLTGHFPLVRMGSFVPFVSAGAGMYRATFDATSTTVPGFYLKRMPGGVMPTHLQTFQDFLMTVGGGANMFLTDHIALRPEVNVMIATTRNDVRPFGVFGIQVVYHFPAHPVE